MMEVHIGSRIGKARTKVVALREQLPPLQQRLAALKAERGEKETIMNGATLDTPPLEVAIASTRIPLLDKAIARVLAELTPLQSQVQEAEIELSQMESQAEMNLEQLPDFQDVGDTDVQAHGVGRWVELLRDVRQSISNLTEAPLAPGARYEPVVSVTYQLLQPGEELPKRGPSFHERQRLAAIEQNRVLERAIASGIEGFTYTPVFEPEVRTT